MIMNLNIIYNIYNLMKLFLSNNFNFFNTFVTCIYVGTNTTNQPKIY